jgi:nucleotide-binding universal stress UspA family protein
MVIEKGDNKRTKTKEYKVLVAVDFSASSARALRMAKSIMGRKPDQILVMHVIDRNFVEKCASSQIGTEKDIRETLFLQVKKSFTDFLRSEGMEDDFIKKLICEGIPFLEINKKAVEYGVDMVIMGNRGNSGDMQTIFFGSTTERVLRFMSRPVLCVPIEEDRK